MRDDTSDSALPRGGDHIWLRQSVTFAVNGQTRTLELALPLRPGATPDEVESLLDEAEAGMRRLSRRLDAHLAEITGATPPAPAPQSPATPRHEPAPAPQPAAATQRATPTPPAIAERAAPQPAATPAAAQSGPDLSRPEFLTAIGSELGLDARAVMERLNVRSLTGLNLRETLDLLRRQGVREGAASSAPAASAPQPAPEPTPEPTPDPTPIGRTRFDEEVDGPEFEVSYPDPDDLPGEDDFTDEEDFAPREVAPTPAPAAHARPTPRASRSAAAGPLSDVPDLDDLLDETTPAAETPAASASDPAEARVRALIATMRAAHAGGQPNEHQRTAYTNIVLDQLGPRKAAGVARALWDVSPERLGPDQLDALIRWGKEDAFADEVEQVLELLRAEYRAQQEQASQQASEPPAAPQRPAAQRAAARERAAEQPTEQPAEPPASARPASRGRSGATGGSARGAGQAGGA